MNHLGQVVSVHFRCPDYASSAGCPDLLCYFVRALEKVSYKNFQSKLEFSKSISDIWKFSWIFGYFWTWILDI